MNTQPQAMNVALDVFEGPMDLLIYLIRKNNLDIYDIPIAQITKEYLSYLEVMKELNLDIAGEFLVMATTLMQIKARTLLPAQTVPGVDEGPDPAAELINKITEYQKYKEASKFLDGQFERFKEIFYRGSPMFSDSEKVLSLELFELVEAVKRAMERVEEDKSSGHQVKAEQFPIETRMDKIIAMLQAREWILIDDVFAGETKKLGVITCFMALLELTKLRRIMARQDHAFAEIRIYLRREPDDTAPAQQEPAQAPSPVMDGDLLFAPAPAQPQQPAQAENTATGPSTAEKATQETPETVSETAQEQAVPPEPDGETISPESPESNDAPAPDAAPEFATEQEQPVATQELTVNEGGEPEPGAEITPDGAAETGQPAPQESAQPAGDAISKEPQVAEESSLVGPETTIPAAEQAATRSANLSEPQLPPEQAAEQDGPAPEGALPPEQPEVGATAIPQTAGTAEPAAAALSADPSQTQGGAESENHGGDSAAREAASAETEKPVQPPEQEPANNSNSGA